jgi:alpha-L-rhamnosidase
MKNGIENMMKRLPVLATLAYGMTSCCATSVMEQEQFSAIDLRCEDLVDPLGVDILKPRLSWKIRADYNGAAQSAYQVLCATAPDLLKEGAADLWESGKVSTSQSQHVLYAGKALPSGIPCYWTVRVWPAPDGVEDPDDAMASAWSKPGMWSYAGMASNKDWQAKWITDSTSSPWLRQTVTLKTVPSSACIYVNALGYFQLFINGKRVGDDEFAPHVGQYNKRTFCITYDVTAYLKKGKNAVGLWLGSGWSRGGAGVNLEPAVRAQLEMRNAAGKVTTLVTDETWHAKASSLAYRGKWSWGNFGGEVHTGSEDQPDWANADYDDSGWPTAKLAKVADTIVSAEMLQRSRIVETMTPVEVTALAENGCWLVDMGKAMTGTFEITFPKAAKGHKVSMEFGDTYTPGKDGALPKMNSFRQVSEYICRGSGVETFKNRFNYASCRYILIKNAPEGELTPEAIKGHFITTDLPKASSFSCSDETLNRIYQMMDHTLRCLMLGGYQVDCHSRERYGYGGDGQSSLDTTLCLLRTDAFYRKWTRDWLDGQKDDGGFTYTSPASGHGGGPFWCGFLPAATLKHYQHYGELSLVKRNYPAIRKWFELAQSKTVDDLQQQFCGRWYLGDWASPDGVNDKANAELFIHAYMSYALEQAALLADALGEAGDATTFRDWAAARNRATHNRFYDPESGTYGSGDQVTYILPLIARVVPEDLRDKVLAGFQETLMVKDKGHLSTGLSGTYLMIQYLQSIGRDDLIYTFASKTTFPSWGYMLENGATATWEHWNGKASRIHNCYNNIGSWFIQGLAGIRPDPEKPGFQHALIKPAFIEELSYMNGSHDTVYGTIESNWKREGDAIVMTVKIPPNSSATIHVPAISADMITVNGCTPTQAEHVAFLGMEDNRAIIEVASGKYVLRSMWKQAQ